MVNPSQCYSILYRGWNKREEKFHTVCNATLSGENVSSITVTFSLSQYLH